MPLVRVGSVIPSAKAPGVHKRPTFPQESGDASHAGPATKRPRLSSSAMGTPGNLPIGMKPATTSSSSSTSPGMRPESPSPMVPTIGMKPTTPSSSSSSSGGKPVGARVVQPKPSGSKLAPPSGSDQPNSQVQPPLLQSMPKKKAIHPTGPPPKHLIAGNKVTTPSNVVSDIESNSPGAHSRVVKPPLRPPPNSTPQTVSPQPSPPKSIPPKPNPPPQQSPPKSIPPKPNPPPQTSLPKTIPPKPNPPKKIVPQTNSGATAITPPTKIGPKVSSGARNTIQRLLEEADKPVKVPEEKTVPNQGGQTKGSPDQKQMAGQIQQVKATIKPNLLGQSARPPQQSSSINVDRNNSSQEASEQKTSGVKEPVKIRPVAKAKVKQIKEVDEQIQGKEKTVEPQPNATSQVNTPPPPVRPAPAVRPPPKTQKTPLKQKIKPTIKPTTQAGDDTQDGKPRSSPEEKKKQVGTIKQGSTFAARQAKSVSKNKVTTQDEMCDAADDYCWDFVSGLCTRGNKCPFVHRRVSETELAQSMRSFSAKKARKAREAGGNNEATEKLQHLFRDAGLGDEGNGGPTRAQETLWESKCVLKLLHGKEVVIVVNASMGSLNMGDSTMLVWCYWINQKLLQLRQELSEDGKKVTMKAYDINFSGNNLGVHGLRALCALLEKHSLYCTVLQLDDNKVDDAALKEITRHLTNFETAPVHELFLHKNKLSPKGLCWLLTSVAMHPAYPIWGDRKFKPLVLHLDETSFSDGVGGDMGVMIQDVSGACFVTVCTGSSEVHFRDGFCKHNCVVRLQCKGDLQNWLSLPPVSPENHAKPIFSPPPVECPPITNTIRTHPSVLFEYEEQAVVYKPAGWVCDPHSANPRTHILSEQVRQNQREMLCRQREHASIQAWASLHFGGNDKARATRSHKLGFGLCHRLDVGTSGPVLMGLTPEGYQHGCSQIYLRDCVKDYLALVHGDVREERGSCRSPIDKSTYNQKRRVHCTEDGDPALTIWEVMAKYESPRNPRDRYTLMHMRIVTGRTHQIRVHLSHMGHPIVTDWTYAKDLQNELWNLDQDCAMCPRIFLHKFRLAFVDMEGFVCSVPCPLQMAPELWNCLSQLRLVGGIALRDCGAPGLPKASWSRS